jgi:KaiC/GvpD/RAD55 family RecA-like ATPase
MKQRRCVVLDSLSELLLTHKTEEAIALLNTMVTQNREYKELHLILLTQGMQDPKIETATQHFADSVIQFTTSWRAETIARTIIVKKNEGNNHPHAETPLLNRKKRFHHRNSHQNNIKQPANLLGSLE